MSDLPPHCRYCAMGNHILCEGYCECPVCHPPPRKGARLKSVWVLQNHMTVVFDTNGEQVPILQGLWEDVSTRVLPLINADKPELHDAPGIIPHVTIRTDAKGKVTIE